MKYIIKRGECYIERGNKVGVFNCIDEIDRATSFTTFVQATDFVSDEMRLNLRSVSVYEFTEDIEWVLVDEWYNIDDTIECDVCGERELLDFAHKARYDFDKQVCQSCHIDGN